MFLKMYAPFLFLPTASKQSEAQNDIWSLGLWLADYLAGSAAIGLHVVSRFHISCQSGVSRALDVIANTEMNCVVFLYALLNSA